MLSDGLDRSVFETMIAGQPYWGGHPYVQKIATEQGKKVKELNAEQDDGKRKTLLRNLLKCKDDAHVAIMVPFFCEYVSPQKVDLAQSSEVSVFYLPGIQYYH
jgi:hypothetical protein